MPTDDFVGITESSENLQQLIDIIYGFCSRWRLHANVNKSAVLVFGKDKVKGKWNWGDHVLPIVSSYTYLGVDFSYNGAWDTHIKKLIQNGKRKVNQLNNIISNRYINLSARRMLLLSVLRPSLEYGSEVWEGNKSQAASLESIMLGGAKRVLGCSSKTSNEAIWGDMGLEFLQGRRDKRKLSWWYKVVNMPLSRYPKQLFQEEWNIKPRPGRQRKVWKRVVDDIFESLELDKGEWVESISEGETSIKEFLALVDESIKESNRCQFLKGLNNKTKLTIYKTFGGEVKFKRYLNGVGDAGTRLLFKLRSGTHGLNEELGRHRGREGKYMCNLCGEDCESVGHFLWNCPVYSERRALFLEHLKNNLGNEFEHF